MLTLSRSVVLAFSTIAILTQACTLASPTTIEMKEKPAEDEAATTDGTTPASSSGGAAAPGMESKCGQKLTKVDISKLKACGTTAKGHCYPKALVPGAAEADYETCEGDDVCISDKQLTAGGEKPKTCKSMQGKPGACLSILSKALKGGMAQGVPRDTCAEDEACAPCIHPITLEDSGACGPSGVFDKACDGAAAGETTPKPVDPSTLCCTTNGKSNGVCAPKDGLPEAAGSAPQLTCKEGNVCIPKALADLKPVKCDAGLLRGGKGMCMDKCFNSMLAKVSGFGALKQETCGETELCVSCMMMKIQTPDQTIPGCDDAE